MFLSHLKTVNAHHFLHLNAACRIHNPGHAEKRISIKTYATFHTEISFTVSEFS